MPDTLITKISLVQITPRLPPAVDGLGDYSINLARQLHKDYGINTHFIVADPTWRGESTVENFTVGHLIRRSPEALLSCLSKDSSTILLHYAGYGYARRGCPRWLVEALEHWRRDKKGRAVITMFHEVYATGPFWRSSFWLSSTQRKLAARLTRISDRVVTNRDGYAELLKQISQRNYQHISVLPVFSNIGEPDQTPLPLSERRRRLVVFGSRGHRQLVFQQSLAALNRTCCTLGIEEIFDVGASVEHGVTNVGGVPVTCTGVQPAHKISNLLLTATIGFFSYPTDYLGKSTIFAAYCAHRLLPIGVYYKGRSADGLRSGQHFWLSGNNDREWSVAAGQTVADNAYRWYQEHNLSKQAGIFATSIASRISNP